MSTLDKPGVTSWTVVFNNKKGKFVLKQEPWKIQVPGRPWAFEAAYHAGWFTCKLGIYYLENDMVSLHIDDMEPIIFPQPNPIGDLIFE